MRPAALFLTLPFLLSSLFWSEARAEPAGKGALDGEIHRVEAELLLDVDEVRPGEAFRAGVRFRMHEGWHIYWRNPGESGLESEILFEGAAFEPLQWPFPQTFRTGGGFIWTYGYDGEVLLFAEGRAPEAPGAHEIVARADVLVCEVDCIPAEFALRLPLRVGQERRASPAAPLFDAAEARVPRHEEGIRATVAAEPDESFRGTLRIEPAGWTPEGEGAFVPDVSPGFETLRGITRGGAILVEGKASPVVSEPPRVRGVARLRSPQGEVRYLEVDAVLEAAPPVATAATETPPLGLVLLFAFAGGALLNLMPCVFPVLAVKVYGFTRLAEESRRGLALNAAAYAAGVVGSLLVLALAVVAARAAGMGVGWGFQFQHPLFVAAVSAVVVAFALNLFGVFHVGLGGQRLVERVDGSRGLVRSAGEGLLAVVLATPCSAPLLGTAVGFAFAAPAWLTIAVFATLGLGLAAPFCLLVLVPGLASRLPKPGLWMERFKQILGFALLGTAAWLVWVMGGLGGVDAMARLLAFLVAVAFACWLFGIAQSAARRRWLGFSVAAMVVLASSGFLPKGVAPEATTSSAGTWSEEAVAKALAEGRPVFVDFTADWCLTCKFNERTVLASSRVREAFEARGVEFLVADWTRRDEDIRRKLAEFGKAGVPMYLLYSPDAPSSPRVLPELLTEGLVLDALASIPEKEPST